MARKNTSKWSMYRRLHAQVSPLLKKSGLRFRFSKIDDDENHIATYDTHVMGTFICTNTQCRKKKWYSKKISITIRQYAGNRYNARVYHQHCKECDTVSRPELDEQSYVDRVVYRIRKWNGVKVVRPPFKWDENPVHESEFCEGCKIRRCVWGDF